MEKSGQVSFIPLLLVSTAGIKGQWADTAQVSLHLVEIKIRKGNTEGGKGECWGGRIFLNFYLSDYGLLYNGYFRPRIVIGHDIARVLIPALPGLR